MSSEPFDSASAADQNLYESYCRVRAQTEELCAPLAVEDFGVQSMPDASPPKWHLAHTTWFFETFILSDAVAEHQSPHPAYNYLFNSYYEGVGPQWYRPQRGVLSRPTVKEIQDWRQSVDHAMQKALKGDQLNPRARWLTELGLHHEQQHQELLVIDIKHGLLQNPIETKIAPPPKAPSSAPSSGLVDVKGGLVEIGHAGPSFAFDNEGPQHRCFLEDFRLAQNLVTNAEYLEFIRDQGYQRPEFWLADAWATIQSENWKSPLYWEEIDGAYIEHTLGGRRPLPPHAPLTHVSFFEADAYARWRGMRLPSEAEWEHAASIAQPTPDGTMLDDGALHPEGRDVKTHGGFRHLLGEVWEFTSSPYRPYPGFIPPKGAVGEYNAKFMNGQYVLRGGSAATPRDHIRPTYRNFFGPDKRWVFTGIRLAEGVEAS